MRSLIDYISEARLPKSKINIDWYNCLTRGPRLDAADVLAKQKIYIDEVFNLFVQWLCDNNDQHTLDMITSARNGLGTNETKTLVTVLTAFTAKYKLPGRVPKDWKMQYDTIPEMLAPIFSACLYGMKDNYLKHEVENYENSKTKSAPTASGKVAINRAFNRDTTITFNEIIYAANCGYSEYQNFDRVLVYIYHDPKLRKEFETKKIDKIDIYSIIDVALQAWGIKDEVVDGDELLRSSVIAAAFYDLCDQLSPSGFKRLFKETDQVDDKYYIITDFQDHAEFIEKYLLGDLNEQAPGITVRYDKNIQYGLYGPKKLPGSSYGYGANSLKTFTAFLNMLDRRYLSNYKGPMPL